MTHRLRPDLAFMSGAFALACLLGGAAGAWAQSAAQPSAPSVAPHPAFGSDNNAANDPLAARNGLRLEHMREDERRKRLQADMARLVELTNQLKAEVDSTAKDELSVTVVRKAAEIEKLAHDVKERMKE